MGYIDIPPVGSASWKDPVSTSANLPSTNNSIGDARVVEATSTIYIWNGAAWTPVSGGGGGANTTLSNLTSPVALNQPLTSTDIANAYKSIDSVSGNYSKVDSASIVYIGSVESRLDTDGITITQNNGKSITLLGDGNVIRCESIPDSTFTQLNDGGFYCLNQLSNLSGSFNSTTFAFVDPVNGQGGFTATTLSMTSSNNYEFGLDVVNEGMFFNNRNGVGGSILTGTQMSTSAFSCIDNITGSSSTLNTDSVTTPKLVISSADMSGDISLQAANTTTSYTVKMPAAQGGASTYLQNDGSGNLSWATVSAGVTSVTATAPLASSGGATPDISITQVAGDADKVLASNGTTASWQYAGLGGGSLGTGNVVLGRGLPVGFGTNTILIGVNATTTVSNTVVIGTSAAANLGGFSIGYNSLSSAGLSIGNNCRQIAGQYSTLIGDGCTTSGSQSVFVGRAITGSSTAGTTVGDAATNNGNLTISMGYATSVASTADNCVVLGTIAVAPAGGSNSIAIGTGCSTGGLSNVFAVGAASYQVNTLYLGRGAADQTVANSVKIMTMKAFGADTDLSAGTLTLAGSQSTGNKPGGDVIISTSPAGSSGSSLNSHVERLRVTHDGKVGIGTNTPGEKLEVNGNVKVSSGDISVATAGRGLSVKEGTNAKIGVTGAFPGGSTNTVTVSTTAVTSNSIIFISAVSGATTIDPKIWVSTITSGTSFVISSGDNSFNGTVGWMIVERIP